MNLQYLHYDHENKLFTDMNVFVTSQELTIRHRVILSKLDKKTLIYDTSYSTQESHNTTFNITHSLTTLYIRMVYITFVPFM